MDFPVYTMQAMLARPAIDWIEHLAAEQGVHPTVVLNALLMYGMYEISAQGVEGTVKLQEFIHTLNSSTPITEQKAW